MKKFILLASILGVFATIDGAQAQRGPGRGPDRGPSGVACSCVELERRIQGLERVLQHARLDRYETRSIERDLRDGYHMLDQVNQRTSHGEQERICSLGNQDVDRSWVRWQPWLAQRRLDPGNRCQR